MLKVQVNAELKTADEFSSEFPSWAAVIGWLAGHCGELASVLIEESVDPL